MKGTKSEWHDLVFQMSKMVVDLLPKEATALRRIRILHDQLQDKGVASVGGQKNWRLLWHGEQDCSSIRARSQEEQN